MRWRRFCGQFQTTDQLDEFLTKFPRPQQPTPEESLPASPSIHCRGELVMDATRFWEIVAESKVGFDTEHYQSSRHEQVRRLHQLLSSLPIEEVLSFLKLFGARMDEAYSRPREGLWAVAFDLGGGCSEDGFDDFRCWLISMGREVFEAAVRDPETVYEVAEHMGGGDDVFFEEFQYVPSQVLRQMTGEEECR